MNSYGDPQSARARVSVPGAAGSAPDDAQAPARYPDEPRSAPDAYRRSGRAAVGGAPVASASVGSAQPGGRAAVGGASVGTARPGGRASVGSASVGSASVGNAGAAGGRAAVARAVVRPGPSGPGMPPGTGDDGAIGAGGGDWLIDGRWTYVDTSLFQLVAGLRYMFPKRMAAIEGDYPGLVRIHDQVADLPGIRAYLKSDRRLDFNQNGIFRHYPELDAA